MGKISQLKAAITGPARRRKRLLKDFDGMVGRVRRVFVARYGIEQTAVRIAEARQEFDSLIPQIPDIGGKQPLTRFLLSTAMFLAMYRVMKRRGESVEQAGKLVYEVSEAFIRSHPLFVRRMVGNLSFSPRYLWGLQRRALESQDRKYPGDYVFTFVEGDGLSFDYGVDYQECASCKFLEAQGAFELARYLCPIDILYSEAFGWGLVRTMTLAEGYDHCDFRFKQGGPTQIRSSVLDPA